MPQFQISGRPASGSAFFSLALLASGGLCLTLLAAPTQAQSARSANNAPATGQSPLQGLQVAQAKDDSESAAEKADTSEAESEKAKSPETITLKTEKLQILLEVDGVFQSTAATEIILKPEAWSSFKIEQVAAHGSSVNAGDPLFVFDAEDIDKELVNLEKSIESSNLTLQLASDELRFLKESTAMDLEQADRAAKIAAEELSYYREVREDRNLIGAELALKMAEFRLEYAAEELKQLTQMYEADDLTEQTEEIILKRTARDVEMAQHGLEEAKLRHQRQLEVLMPREKQSLIETQSRTALAKAKSVVTLPIALKKKELDYTQLKKDLDEKKKKRQQLQADRELMTITAPTSGLVYYGQATLGKWSEISTREKQLRPGASAPPQQVLMTIVDPQKLEVLLSLSETQLAQVRENQLAIVKPQALLDERLWGRVSQLTSVQQGDGKFAITVALKQPDQPLPLTPGMTSKTVIRIHENEKAILVPEASVFRDEFAEDSAPYVWVHQEEGEPKRQTVETGFTKHKNVEIVSGLKPGMQILKKAPE